MKTGIGITSMMSRKEAGELIILSKDGFLVFIAAVNS